MRMMMMGALLALAACKAAPPANDTADAGAATSLDAAVAQVEKSWASGSAASAMAPYADGAVVFFTDREAPTVDRNVVTASTGAFMAMKPADFTVADRRVQKLGDDAGIFSGIISFTANAGNGRPVLRARFSQVLERQADGTWKIVHEHMSIPPAAAPAP